MRWAGLVLAFVAIARAGETVDIFAGWREGDVCDRKIEVKMSVRDTLRREGHHRAVTLEIGEEAHFRDVVLSTTPRGLPGRVERHCRRRGRTMKMQLAGIKSKTERETDPSQGSRRRLDEKRRRDFLVETLDRAFVRKGVGVGDTWSFQEKRASDGKESAPMCKLSKVLAYEGQRTARICTTLRTSGTFSTGEIEAAVRGYVYFSLESRRIIRTNLRGNVELRSGKVGTMYGELREESTPVMVKKDE